MTVGELIGALLQMPRDAEVWVESSDNYCVKVSRPIFINLDDIDHTQAEPGTSHLIGQVVIRNTENDHDFHDGFQKPPYVLY